MSGGGSGGGSTTSSQSSEPWAGVRPYLEDAYAKAKVASDNTSTAAFTGNFIQPANDIQKETAHQNIWLGNSQNGSGNNLINEAQKNITGGYLDSPYLKQAIDATVRPTIDNLVQTALPAVGSAAQKAGAYGGSRQAFLEARTISDASQNVGDIAAKMLNENYGRERLIQTSIAPTMLQQGQQLNQQAMLLKQQGADQLYNYDQLVLNNEKAKFEDEINRYWRGIAPYTGALSGLGFSGGTTTGTTTAPSGSAVGGALTGAAGGAAMGTMIMPGWGTAAGALLGAGMGMMR